MSDNNAEVEDYRNERRMKGVRVLEALQKLTPEQIAKLPTPELIALAIKEQRG